VGQENIRPKSIAREMFEEHRSFNDYIKVYELQRSEGILLRHLASVHKVLAQTVPDAAKNDEVREMELYLSAMLRQVDSSLLEEWEKMPTIRNGAPAPRRLKCGPQTAVSQDITRDAKAFTAAIRVRTLRLPALARERRSRAGARDGSPRARMTRGRPSAYARRSTNTIASTTASASMRRGAMCSTPTSRLSEDQQSWSVQQMLIDPEEANDWVAEFIVDLPASRAAGEPVVSFARLGGLV